MREVAEEALARYDLPLLQIFGNALRAAGLFLDPKHVPQIYCHIENYLRGRERVEMVRSLRGLSVHLFGGQVDVDNIVITKGWKEYLSDCPWVTLHPTVSYEESLRIMSRSKVLLNSSPQFRGGAHDRVVNGMACGAVVCTNDNPFMRRHFDGGREVCLFQYGRWRDLKEEIQSMLAQEGRRKEIASGREKVLAAHTWDHRVRDLVAAFPSLLQKTGVCV